MNDKCFILSVAIAEVFKGNFSKRSDRVNRPHDWHILPTDLILVSVMQKMFQEKDNLLHDADGTLILELNLPPVGVDSGI